MNVEGQRVCYFFVILFICLVFLTLYMLSGIAYGGVAGYCSNCHTMHHSQTPWSWNPEWGGPSGNPRENLLVADCAECHTNYTDSETIVTLGSGGGQSQVPIVFNVSQPPTHPLAGGNFYWVHVSGDAYGHNVTAIPGIGQDVVLLTAPGGSEGGGSCSGCHDSLSSCKSCHVPVHHAPAPQGTQLVGADEGYFRFLGPQSENEWGGDMEFHTNAGVKGVEDNDWEFTKSSSDHNEYSGETSNNESLSGGIQSISDSCGCHNGYHRWDGTYVGDQSPWKMHPTDTELPIAGEYSGYTTYSNNAPVARPDIDSYSGGPSGVVTPGTDQVMCLSCHRAHGSPYWKDLRWDYKGNDWSGCGTCHTSKQ